MLRAKYPDSSLTAEVMWWLGEYYYRKNDLNLAQRYFSSLIQDFPNTNLVADAYYAIGSIFTQESRYQEAMDNFTKVIELSQSDLAGQAAVALADIYAKQGKFDLATQVYKEKAQQYPNLSHLIYPKIGDIFAKQARYEEALDFYRRSLSVVPVKETADVHFKMAEVLQAQGKNDQALEEYMKVTYLYAQNLGLGVKAFLRVAKAYEDADNIKEAVKIYRKVVSLNVPESKYAQERIDSIESQGETKN
jgi:TolA-binding protein